MARSAINDLTCWECKKQFPRYRASIVISEDVISRFCPYCHVLICCANKETGEEINWLNDALNGEPTLLFCPTNRRRT